MLFSFALILICGFILSGLFQKIKIPGLLGMLLTGIILGPYLLDLISPSILAISTDLRQIALIIILTRAGLSMDLKDLRKVGRPAILLCFIPASLEIIAIMIFAPMIFGISLLDAALLGSILAAVSPAVVVPKMLKMMESGYGKENKIPQLIMAGASVDDVYVLVLFASFLGMHQGKSFDFISILQIPLSIIMGIVLGGLSGLFIIWLFKKMHMRDTVKIMTILSVSFLFVAFEAFIKPFFPVSGLLAVMTMGVIILKQNGVLANRLSLKFSKIWVGAEVLLFVLVGATVEISCIPKAGLLALLLIVIALLFRSIGVLISLTKTPISAKERLFCIISYLPKATVQAAIGGIPLALGISSGSLILTIAVVAIILTAPLGAIGIELTYKKLLRHDNN